MKQSGLIFLLAAALLGLWGASRVHESLRDYRETRLLPHATPLEDAPPLMAFTTVALGGFRGLIADLLWLRSIRLQREARVFELVQLADWITKLEPHFTTVWAFQSWNMAYNISVLFPDPETRWRWVQNGIRLLRDEGIRYNPRDPNLCWNLGWLYQHKIGFIMDSAHPFYKRRLADEMQAALHGPRPPAEAEPEQAAYLRDILQLDPGLMRRLDADYGPFDWRLPETLAFYWAWRGLQAAVHDPEAAGPAAAGSACECHPHANEPASLSSARACYQMLFQCLSAAFRQGRLDFDPAVGIYVTTPRLDLLPHVMKIYEKAIARYHEPLFEEVYGRFLGEAVFMLQAYGYHEPAALLFRQAQTRQLEADRTQTYEAFISQVDAAIRSEPTEVVPATATALVEGLLFQGCRLRAAGDADRAATRNREATDVWETYMQARASEDHRQRTSLPALDLLRLEAERRARDEPDPPVWPAPSKPDN